MGLTLTKLDDFVPAFRPNPYDCLESVTNRSHRIAAHRDDSPAAVLRIGPGTRVSVDQPTR
jgi:hypothetical protein